MKLIQQKYFILNLERNSSSWLFTLPSGVVDVNDPRDKLKVYAKKIVYRNDFIVLTEGRNSINVNGVNYTVRSGSPNALLFMDELNSLVPDLFWTFDPYNSTVYVANKSEVTSYEINTGTLGTVLGFTGSFTVPPFMQHEVGIIDLSPPEVLIWRMNGLSSASLELTKNDFRNTDILCIIGTDVVPYATKVYRDVNGMFGHFLTARNLTNISLHLEDVNGVDLKSPNPITIIMAVEVWRDTEEEILRNTAQHLELSRLGLIGASLNKEKNLIRK
jgi:hypothetical protein